MSADGANASDERLTVTPVGVGTAYSAPGVDQACFLVEVAGKRILLDLGAGSLNRLQQQIDPVDLDLILISHLHPDHCIDLFSLQVYLAWGPGKGVTHPGARDRRSFGRV